ncbi:uncharacterized protein LOC144070726 [Stigmatopora argus]
MQYIKEEAEPETPYIKEEEQDDIPNFPMRVIVKSEEDDQESRTEKPWLQQPTPEVEGRSLPGGLLAPLSDSDDVTSHSSDEEYVDFDPKSSKPLNESSLNKETEERKDLLKDILTLRSNVKQEMPSIKEEVEPVTPHTKEEDQITDFPSTVIVKSENHKDPSLESGTENPFFQDPTHKGEGPPPPDRLLAPLSDSDDVTSHSSNEEDVDFEPKSSKLLNVTSLKKHTKERRKPFACTLCDKRYYQKHKLKIHTRMHTGEKPFVCTICGKPFKEKVELIRHTRTHTGEKPFACTLCEKRFCQKSNLTVHARTHTGEKPFPCSICGKRFKEKVQLVRHATTHTREKTFSCQLCEKRFSRKNELTRHTRNHTGENTYPCSVCGKRFSEKGALILHTRTHTGEKPFACKVCGQTFNVKGNLTRHTKAHAMG